MHQEETKKVTTTLTTPRAIILAGVLVALVLFITRSSPGTALQDATDRALELGGSAQQGLVNKVTEDDFIQGAKNPKVTIVEFSDFGCSFCAQFHPTLQAIVDAYPNDVAWVYRHLPFRNETAAIASECVGQELGDEAFWAYSKALFDKYPNITEELMTEEAIALGFKNKEAFMECRAREEVVARVDQTAAEARLIGAQGTPHSLVIAEDGRTFPIRGAMSFEQIDQIVTMLIAE